MVGHSPNLIGSNLSANANSESTVMVKERSLSVSMSSTARRAHACPRNYVPLRKHGFQLLTSEKNAAFNTDLSVFTIPLLG
jgi:hypothetical protein